MGLRLPPSHADHLPILLTRRLRAAGVEVGGPLRHADRHVGACTAFLEDARGGAKEKTFQGKTSNMLPKLNTIEYS